MSAELDRLKAQVARTKDVEQSAVSLITGLAARIREIQGDTAALAALADELDAQASALGTAVAENTPAE